MASVKTSITGPLLVWGESIGDRWIPLTKGPVMRTALLWHAVSLSRWLRHKLPLPLGTPRLSLTAISSDPAVATESCLEVLLSSIDVLRVSSNEFNSSMSDSFTLLKLSAWIGCPTSVSTLPSWTIAFPVEQRIQSSTQGWFQVCAQPMRDDVTL